MGFYTTRRTRGIGRYITKHLDNLWKLLGSYKGQPEILMS